MIIKYFYLLFTAVSARLKHNFRFLFQENMMYKKRKDTSIIVIVLEKKVCKSIKSLMSGVVSLLITY